MAEIPALPYRLAPVLDSLLRFWDLSGAKTKEPGSLAWQDIPDDVAIPVDMA